MERRIQKFSYPEVSRKIHDIVATLTGDSEIPTLAEKTWDGLWGDILSSDVPNNDILHADDDEDIGTSMHMVEEDIEQWAMQYLPPVIEAPSDLQNPLLEPLKSTSAGSSTNQLCYGMVSFTDTLL